MASIFPCFTHKALPAETPEATNTSLTGTYWKLTELMGQPIVNTDDTLKEMHIILKSEGNQINGHGGCNSFMGGYTLLVGNRISFTQLANTMMACSNMDKEKEFMDQLQKVDNYAITGNKLSLHKARMAPLARFEAVYMK